jgi:type II secretory pathway pseudopilin PulG
MKRALRLRSLAREESGMTLVEMLVAAMMSVIIVGASCAMLISAVRDQPGLSRKAENVTTARYQLERIVREVRNGVKLETTTPAEVTLVARVRRVSCGGAFQTDSSAEPVQCRITYRCSGKSCTRTEETLAGTPVGTPTVAVSGIGDTNVFCFVPSAEEDPTQCGAVPQEGTAPTYVGVNLSVPNPEGSGLLTVSDGATLRTAAFSS